MTKASPDKYTIGVSLLLIAIVGSLTIHNYSVQTWLSSTQGFAPSENTTHHSSAAKPPELAIHATATTTARLVFDPVSRLLDTSRSDPQISKELHLPYGFAFDSKHQRLVWTSAGDQTFKVLQENGVGVIPSNFEAPFTLIARNSYGYDLYLYNDGAIRHRSVDHQAMSDTTRVVAKLDQDTVHGLGLDESEHLLYVGDQKGQVQLVIELTSGNIETLSKTPLKNHRNRKEGKHP